MHGFNPFRALGVNKLLASGSGAASTAAATAATATAAGGGGASGSGHRRSPSSPIVHGGGAVAGLSAGGAPLTQARQLHRATHPLHLLRRHNSEAATIGQIRRDLEAGVSRPAEELPAATPLPLPTTGPMAHAADCTCCRRPYGTRGGGSNLRDDIYERNLRNAERSKRRALHHGEDVEEDCGGMGFDQNTAAEANHRSITEEKKLEREVARFVGGRLVQSLQRSQPPRGSGIQPLLDYNKQWAGEVARLNSDYFSHLAVRQNPQYLWVGCSDSRVPANEIVGLYPGDVFVHRNIANIVCNSDLNALAVLQYAIDCLKVEHVIITGHYKCGGVTAALNDDRVGLADHWILHVSAVKKRHWRRMVLDIPSSRHLDALCELNVLAQVESVVETHLVQQVWARQNAEDALSRKEDRPSRNHLENEVEIHGWVYGLEDGMIRPLLSLNRRSNVEKELADAVEAVFMRYGLMT